MYTEFYCYLITSVDIPMYLVTMPRDNNTDPLTAKILHPIILLLEELRRWRLYCVWRYSNGTLKR